MNLLLITTMTVIVSLAAVIDLREQRIPNLITLPCFIAAPAYYTLLDGWDGLFFSTAGLAVGIGLLLLPYLMGGMGAGDAKLMGAVGGFIGAKGVLYAFIFTAISGGIYAILLMIIFRNQFKGFFTEKKYDLLSIFLTRKLALGQTPAAASERPRLCYGLAIAVGTCVYIVLNITGVLSL
jgi:prepilin peptidase CpaA